MRNYTIRKLIKGYRIKPTLKDKTLVAIPFKYKGEDIKVTKNNDSIVIDHNSQLLHSQSFEDKYGRNKNYTLYYYEWKVNSKQQALFNNSVWY